MANLRFWWINQGRTDEASRKRSYVWAAVDRLFHHKNVSRIKPGDIIFHYVTGQGITSWSVAETDGHHATVEEAARLDRHSHYVARVRYRPLRGGVRIGRIAEALRRLDLDYSPINKNATVNQGYCYLLTMAAAKLIADEMQSEDAGTELSRALAGA